MDNGGDGKLQPKIEKTEEQLASERFARYQKDPNSFTEVSELVIGVKRSPKGLMYVIQGGELELNLCLSELTRRILNVLNLIEYSKQDKKIIPAKGSMFNFARGRK